MAKRRRKFNNRKRAESFAKAVNGKFNDLRDVEECKANFSVTYFPQETNYPCRPKHKNPGDNSANWAPEEGRDFGYPNDYWN